MFRKAFVFLAKCVITVEWKSGDFLYHLQYLKMCAPFQLYDFPTIQNLNQHTLACMSFCLKQTRHLKRKYCIIK